MKMTTRVAYDNMKYYKSRNLLIGIAIVLTTMLLLVIPTVGQGMVDLQFAATNKVYPSWHALYRGVDEDTVRKLAAHHDIARYRVYEFRRGGFGCHDVRGSDRNGAL